MESLLYYKEDGYLDINNFLRTTPITVPKNLNSTKINKHIKDLKIKKNDYKEYVEKQLNHIKNIDSYMTYTPYSKTFYRGFSHMNDTFDKLLKEGGSLISKNYSSVSYDKNIPKNFINENVGCCLLSFKIPMDIKSFDFEPLEKKHKHLEQEKEVLLERNIEFEIIEKINGVYIAKLRKYDPFKSKELKEVEKIKKELEKMKKDKQKNSVLERDINEFIKNDYDGGSVEDAYLDFELLYTVNEDDEEMIKKLLSQKINKKGGRKKINRKKIMTGGGKNMKKLLKYIKRHFKY
jgi:uncharacterized protein YbcC (UPF0753/DUF2309 family)